MPTNWMSLLQFTPSFIIGITLCVIDLQYRRVPRRLIIAGTIAQLTASSIWANISADTVPGMGDAWPASLSSIAIATACALIQWILSTLKAGSLGFGDVTATFFFGIGVGYCGLFTAAVWWLSMGAVGSAALANARFHRSHDVAFVPVIFISALIAILAHIS
jgi:leader peptidase (prepilin peptidase)/N-methyltransferase